MVPRPAAAAHQPNSSCREHVLKLHDPAARFQYASPILQPCLPSASPSSVVQTSARARSPTCWLLARSQLLTPPRASPGTASAPPSASIIPSPTALRLISSSPIPAATAFTPLRVARSMMPALISPRSPKTSSGKSPKPSLTPTWSCLLSIRRPASPLRTKKSPAYSARVAWSLWVMKKSAAARPSRASTPHRSLSSPTRLMVLSGRCTPWRPPCLASESRCWSRPATTFAAASAPMPFTTPP